MGRSDDGVWGGEQRASCRRSVFFASKKSSNQVCKEVVLNLDRHPAVWGEGWGGGGVS